MNPIDFLGQTYNDIFVPVTQNYIIKLELCDFLYHYTSQHAFSEIISHKELWLSHALDLNDPDEIIFGIDVVTNILKTRLQSNSKCLKLIDNERENFSKYNGLVDNYIHFILSFSKLNDDLKQWVHYADGALGVSIEFVLSKIISSIEPDNNCNPILMPVVYFQNSECYGSENELFVKLVESIFKKIDEKLQNIVTSDNTVLHQRIIFQYVLILASFIKQSLYSNEFEWRLLIRTGIGNKNIKFPVINGVTRMKLALKFDIDTIPKMINSVMIGPKSYQNITNKISLNLLVKSKMNGREININRSNGKLR